MWDLRTSHAPLTLGGHGCDGGARAARELGERDAQPRLVLGRPDRLGAGEEALRAQLLDEALPALGLREQRDDLGRALDLEQREHVREPAVDRLARAGGGGTAAAALRAAKRCGRVARARG